MNLYLVRHGQAGTRDAYDALSKRGFEQARLLGAYFAAQRIKFAAAYAGEMERHQLTANGTIEGYGREDFPELVTDPHWNEFDLVRLYREIAPRLSAQDEDFRRDYETMRAQVLASKDSPDAHVHRRWLPADTTVVNAWISGEHDAAGETWQEFQQRIVSTRARFDSAQRNDNIIVFTSATPVAIWTGLAFGVTDARLMQLAGVLHNSSFTIIQTRDDALRLFTFNATPHLSRPDLRTFR